MYRFTDLTGKRIGRLTVLSRAENRRSKTGASYVVWLCRCDCGNECFVRASNLTNTKRFTSSCGCLMREKARNPKTITHGKSNTRLFRIWDSMKRRCYTKTKDSYPLYGGRGIEVCDEWKSDFMAFYEWSMSNGYDDNLTIDRIDVNGNYCPENCRWVDFYTQNNNKRDNVVLKYNNEVHTVAEWARISGINERTLRGRLKRGYSIKDAFEKVVDKSVRIK